jgi:type III secretory pathway component EscS
MEFHSEENRMIKNKWKHRFSHHEALMIFLAITPVVVIMVIIGYLIGLIF